MAARFRPPYAAWAVPARIGDLLAHPEAGTGRDRAERFSQAARSDAAR